MKIQPGSKLPAALPPANVDATIADVSKDGYLTKAEAQRVVTVAESGGVTVPEMKSVAGLFDRAIKQPTPPGQGVTMAVPENPGDVMGERAAKPVLEEFFARHNVPAGEQRAVYKARIELSLAEHEGPITNVPPDTKRLFSFDLTPVGLQDVVRTAWVDPKADKLYVSTSGMGPDGFTSIWSGPVDLKKLDTTPLSDAAAKALIKDAFAAQFPPRQSASFTLDPATLSVDEAHNGKMSFRFDASKSIGGIAGPVDGGTSSFQGSIDLATRKVAIVELTAFEPASVIGLSEAAAVATIEAAGWKARVSQRDGQFLPGTTDIQRFRANLTVNNGVVSGVDVG